MSDTYEIENDGASYSQHGVIAELVAKNCEILQLKKDIIATRIERQNAINSLSEMLVLSEKELETTKKLLNEAVMVLEVCANNIHDEGEEDSMSDMIGRYLAKLSKEGGR